jgi:hypothetical protein
MKIRNGFVSNSSSSNFIVAIKTEGPTTVKALQKLLGLSPESPAAKFFEHYIDAIASGEPHEFEDELATEKEKADLLKQKEELSQQLEAIEEEYKGLSKKEKESPRGIQLQYASRGVQVASMELNEKLLSLQRTEEKHIPFKKERLEGGWQFVSVELCETENISMLECPVLKVEFDYEAY